LLLPQEFPNLLHLLVGSRDSEAATKNDFEFGLEHVYNADETGVFFRQMPSNTLCVGNETPAGKKKVKPWVIGKSAQPRGLKPSTEFVYRNNKKAWMTNLLFLEYKGSGSYNDLPDCDII